MGALSTLILSNESLNLLLAICGIWLSLFMFTYPYIEDTVLRRVFPNASASEARKSMKNIWLGIAAISGLAIAFIVIQFGVSIIFGFPNLLKGYLPYSWWTGNYWIRFIVTWGTVLVLCSSYVFLFKIATSTRKPNLKEVKNNDNTNSDNKPV